MNRLWWGLMLLLCLPALAQPTLRAGLANDSGESLRANADDGLSLAYRDALALIARQSGVHFQLDYYPSQRLEQLFQVGKLDVEVGVNASWRALSPVAGFYTQPIADAEFVLCLPPDKGKRPATLASLKGGTIGTLLGQRFPSLESAFASRKLLRDGSANEDEMLDKLRQGRVQAVVLERRRAQYWSRRDEGGRCLPGESLGSLPVALRLHPRYRDLLPGLNQAIQQLHDQGRLRPLFARH
ncbi:substrate-binding periplasmic protein [Chromobacterium vaccinii]|nr:transporter substrate-binding domain-containing protein [Chromobacterium vaccinii]SUX29914.1 Bacterial extracellular solute-binding proteins, family 3 [Chromobacterium vaccinii]